MYVYVSYSKYYLMSPFALSVVAAAVIISVTSWLYRWLNPPYNGKLPPGSMGWPIVGETRQFFTPSTSFDIFPFVKQRIIRLFIKYYVKHYLN